MSAIPQNRAPEEILDAIMACQAAQALIVRAVVDQDTPIEPIVMQAQAIAKGFIDSMSAHDGAMMASVALATLQMTITILTDADNEARGLPSL